ncbi:MAG: hypothetical protein LBO78_03260 [Rickettsiales bacterium]|jgi:hypothetical protein|nr:hypothetical protein [Rickettsiales bacterium]
MKKIFKLDGGEGQGVHIASMTVFARHFSGADDFLDGTRRSRRRFDKKAAFFIGSMLRIYSAGYWLRSLFGKSK